MRKLLAIPATLGLAVLVVASLAAQPEPSPEHKALHKRAEAFVAAFNKGDAKALAEFWAPEGDLVDQAGRHLKGRKSIEKGYQKFFAEKKGAKLFITVTSLRVVKPDLAIEDGLTEVVYADGPPTGARYTAVHVKHEGRWLLDSVREAVAAPPSNHEHLEELEWLVGEWASEDADKGKGARVSYSWAQNQNFLVASFATTVKDVPLDGGVQWIGWDAGAKHIRSWAFDSSGGFSEGYWTREGPRWVIKSTTTLRDGKKVTATNTITQVDADHLTWHSGKRALDGKDLPESPAIKLKRVK